MNFSHCTQSSSIGFICSDYICITGEVVCLVLLTLKDVYFKNIMHMLNTKILITKFNKIDVD